MNKKAWKEIFDLVWNALSFNDEAIDKIDIICYGGCGKKLPAKNGKFYCKECKAKGKDKE